MTKYYKAVTENYKDFYSGEIDYSVGSTVEHPEPGPHGDTEAYGYLSVTTDPTDVPGLAHWPLRMLEVEVEDGWESGSLPNKVCTHKLTVVREIEAWKYFGDHGERILRMAQQANSLSESDAYELQYQLGNVRENSTFHDFRYKIVYQFGKRPSAYEITDLISGDWRFHSVMEGIAVEDLLDHDLRDYVWELAATWDSFFDRTPTQTFWGRVKHFFKSF